MKKYALPSSFALLCALTLGATSLPEQASAQSLQCGSVYTVKSGDSLSKIARRAYGDTTAAQLIYSANSKIIGSNPGLIYIGTVLQIPCLNQSGPSQANAAAIRQVNTTDALPAPLGNRIRVVVGTDWAPFTNEDQEQGGMITEVTNLALSKADGNPAYKIDFVNDWSAHLQPLITDHAYDFSIAWFKPKCEIADRLGKDAQFRCNNLDWSEPLFEQVLHYYTRADHPRPATYTDFYNLTFCRPQGYSTSQLAENNLVEPNVKFAQPEKVEDCFAGLAEGKYDVVFINSNTADDAIAALGVQNKIVAQEHLGQISAMHAVIAKTHPRREQYLAALDSGIRKIKASGEWFRIVTRHMAEHKAKTASN